MDGCLSGSACSLVFRWLLRGCDWEEALWGCNLLVQERVGIKTREVHIKSKRESNSASHDGMSPSGHRA